MEYIGISRLIKKKKPCLLKVGKMDELDLRVEICLIQQLCKVITAAYHNNI